MSYFITVLLILTMISSLILLFQKNHLDAIIAYGIFGAVMTVVLFVLNAPDVAIVEATVGSAFIFFIYLIAVKKVSKIKIYYYETPYLFENKKGNTEGFEKYILDEFLKKNGFETEYIEIKNNDVPEDFDIIAGGIIAKESEKFFISDPILPTKMIKIGKDNIYHISNYKYKGISEDFTHQENIILDLVRLKYRVYKKGHDEKNEFLENEDYRFIFSKKNKKLLDDFNIYLSELKNDEKTYNSVIRRNIG